MLGVPLMREGLPIGVFVLMRRTMQPFTDKQIELAETFADQTVIAIENVRLFEAEQQRSRELTESLQQQSATADVLKIISRSAFDLRAVLQTLVESAARFCAANQATIIREKDGSFYAAGLVTDQRPKPLPWWRRPLRRRVRLLIPKRRIGQTICDRLFQQRTSGTDLCSANWRYGVSSHASLPVGRIVPEARA